MGIYQLDTGTERGNDMTTREPTAQEIAREAIEQYRRDVEADDRLRAATQQPIPQRSRLGLMDRLMYLVCFVLAGVLLWVILIAPIAERMGLIAPAQGAPQPTATAAPRPTTPPYQPAQQYQAPPVQEAAPPTAVPATAGPLIVVTPTFQTGCHDGVPYVDGVPTNGGCGGGGYAPEVPTATVQVWATSVPPDDHYKDVIRQQAPHCIRCAP